MITYVIRTLNSARTLPSVLEKLQAGGARPPVVCVDSGSTDATTTIASSYGAKVISLDHGKFSYGRALNVGFRACDTSWIVSLSSHCIPVFETYHGDFLEVLERMPREVAVVGGQVVHLKKSVSRSRTFLISDDVDSAFFRPHFIGNPNAAYRRNAYIARAFSESLAASEDVDWARWAGRSGLLAAVSYSVPVAYRRPGGVVDFFMKGRREAAQNRMLHGESKDQHAALDLPIQSYFAKIAYRAGRKMKC